MLCHEPLLPTTDADPAERRSMQEFVGLVLSASPVSEADLAKATAEDPLLSSIVRRAISGCWTNHSSAEEPYFLVRHNLTVLDGILMMDNRFIIPAALQMAVLRLAHEDHPGPQVFLDSLRHSVWWPHLTKDANRFASDCDICWRSRTNHTQELQPTEIVPVWHKVAVDLVEVEGRHLLSVVDYGSRFPEAILLGGTTTRHVIAALSDIFARNGLPSQLVSDNGPQFASAEFSSFLQQASIQHVRASPRYPQANGMVERFHRTLRARFATLNPELPFRQRLQQVLFSIRTSTHRMLGTTPARAFFGRDVRTRVPGRIQSPIVQLDVQMQQKLSMARGHDQRRGVKNLVPLSPGTPVILQDGHSSPTKLWNVVEQRDRSVVLSDGIRVGLPKSSACAAVDTSTSNCHRS